MIFSFRQEKNIKKIRGHWARTYTRRSQNRKWMREKEEGKTVVKDQREKERR